MYRLIYPVKTQELFVNRVAELEILDSYKNRLLQGEANKIALIGTRRIGKSTILYEFIKRNLSNRELSLVYINLQGLVIEPLSFTKSYVGLITKWLIQDAADNFAHYDDLQFCMLQLQKLNSQAAEYLYKFIETTQQRELSLKRLLELAFNFPKILSQILNKPFIIMIDEFQEITALNNFKNLPEISGFMRDSFQTHDRILYIFSGSYIRLMQNILENSDSPLFGQINPYYISHFDKETSLKLIDKIGRLQQLDIATATKKKMVQLTSGHPFYIELLANAVYESKYIDGIELTEENVEKILLLQLLNEKSILSFHLRYIYNDALGRARGTTILHGILKILAKDAPLTITEIANRMSRKPGLIQLSLAELMKVDLVTRKDKQYFISDFLLRWWIYLKFYHPEGSFSLEDELVNELSSHFREKYLQVTLELGRTKEFELHYFVTKNQGKKVGNTQLPIFKKIIKNYLLPNGDEIDLFARDSESWVFELKWKNKLVGMKELQNLKKKIQVDRYVLISKKGFTKELIDFSSQSAEVILWGADVLANL